MTNEDEAIYVALGIIPDYTNELERDWLADSMSVDTYEEELDFTEE